MKTLSNFPQVPVNTEFKLSHTSKNSAKNIIMDDPGTDTYNVVDVALEL